MQMAVANIRPLPSRTALLATLGISRMAGRRVAACTLRLAWGSGACLHDSCHVMGLGERRDVHAGQPPIRFRANRPRNRTLTLAQQQAIT